jgi:prophage maintenance system killer protein
LKATRVRDLARRANLDLDEALVTLWDAGLDRLSGPNDLVPARELRIAQLALGIEGERAQLTVAYWLVKTGLSRDELAARLAEAGLHLSPQSRNIPKNALRRLRQMFDAKPVTVSQVAPSSRPRQTEPLEWRIIGTTPVRRYLDADDLRTIHQALEEEFLATSDPIEPPGVRDADLLESASWRPRTSNGNELKYPTAEMAGAALFHSTALNHAFYNGNKRTALISLLAFLDLHGLVATCEQADIFKVTLRTAQHGLVATGVDALADREVLNLSTWIKNNTRRVDRGERSMKWISLDRRLRDFGCTVKPTGNVGNRVNIVRTIQEPARRFHRSRVRELRTQVACSGQGTEADRGTIHKIRRDLELDDDHGVDSASFYEGAKIDSFIIDYRRILKRLAKL